MIADGDDRNERWHEHDPTRCSDEIPPWSFETARLLLWRNTNNELLPVYDRQLCEWYLQRQILRCECLGDNKCFLISLKSEFVTQIWGKSTAFPQIWVTNSDLSDKLKFEWNRLVSPRFEWTLKFERSPRIEGITLRSPRIECFTYFWGWSSTCLTHWGRMTHICVSKLTIIGSDNGLSPDRRQAIIWSNAGILLIGPLGTNFSEMLIEILTFSFKKMRLKVSSAKRRPFCLGLNVLRRVHIRICCAIDRSSDLNRIPLWRKVMRWVGRGQIWKTALCKSEKRHGASALHGIRWNLIHHFLKLASMLNVFCYDSVSVCRWGRLGHDRHVIRFSALLNFRALTSNLLLLGDSISGAMA